MDNRASNLHLQLAGLAWLTIMLAKCANRQDSRFIQSLGLDFNGMPQTLGIEIGDDTRRHDAEFSIFDNFRQIRVGEFQEGLSANLRELSHSYYCINR